MAISGFLKYVALASLFQLSYAAPTMGGWSVREPNAYAGGTAGNLLTAEAAKGDNIVEKPDLKTYNAPLFDVLDTSQEAIATDIGSSTTDIAPTNYLLNSGVSPVPSITPIVEQTLSNAHSPSKDLGSSPMTPAHRPESELIEGIGLTNDELFGLFINDLLRQQQQLTRLFISPLTGSPSMNQYTNPSAGVGSRLPSTIPSMPFTRFTPSIPSLMGRPNFRMQPIDTNNMQLVDEQIINDGNSRGKIQTYTSNDPNSGAKTVVKTATYTSNSGSGSGSRGMGAVNPSSSSSISTNSDLLSNAGTAIEWPKLSDIWHNTLSQLPSQMQMTLPKLQFV